MIGYYTFTENERVLHPSDTKPNSMMIFDDVVCEQQTNITNYILMRRHTNIAGTETINL